MNTPASSFVLYYRVSTKKQGDSGLGLEAQERDIALFLDSYAEKHRIVDQYTEIDSGKNSDREQLNKAIEVAKKSNATLLVSKLDRLSRDVEFIARTIKEVNLKVACMPYADKFQLHLYAALAEQEREFISIRTKAALARLKSNGVKLGGNPQNITKMNESRSKGADIFAKKLKPIVLPMIDKGSSLREIANSINQAGIRTTRGKEFSATTVKRIIERIV